MKRVLSADGERIDRGSGVQEEADEVVTALPGRVVQRSLRPKGAVAAAPGCVSGYGPGPAAAARRTFPLEFPMLTTYAV